MRFKNKGPASKRGWPGVTITSASQLRRCPLCVIATSHFSLRPSRPRNITVSPLRLSSFTRSRAEPAICPRFFHSAIRMIFVQRVTGTVPFRCTLVPSSRYQHPSPRIASESQARCYCALPMLDETDTIIPSSNGITRQPIARIDKLNASCRSRALVVSVDRALHLHFSRETLQCRETISHGSSSKPISQLHL